MEISGTFWTKSQLCYISKLNMLRTRLCQIEKKEKKILFPLLTHIHLPKPFLLVPQIPPIKDSAGGFPGGGLSGEESACQCRRLEFDP